MVSLLSAAIIIMVLAIGVILIRRAVISSTKDIVSQERVNMRFQPGKSSFPIHKVQFISVIIFMPPGAQLSAIDLTIRAKGIAIESAGSVEPLEPNTGVFKEITKEKTQDGYHVSYISFQKESLLPRIARIPLAIERSEPGDVTLSIDRAKSTIVGTPDNKAFIIDADSVQFSFK